MANNPRPTGEIPDKPASQVTFRLRDQKESASVILDGTVHQVTEALGRKLHNPTDKPHWFRFEDVFGDSYIFHTQSVSTITVSKEVHSE